MSAVLHFKSTELVFFDRMKKSIFILFFLISPSHFAQSDSSVFAGVLLEARKFYPELIAVPIDVSFGKGASPFTTRPLFGTENHFRIVVSRTVKSEFVEIQFDRLSKSAQIGVLCHELAHVVQFLKFNRFDWSRYIIQQLLPRKIDLQENTIDRIAISHGAGGFLYQWSKEVRFKLGYQHWNGTRLKNSAKHERYLDPLSIIAIVFTQTDFNYPTTMSFN